MRKNTKYKVSQTRSLELVLWCSGLVGHYHDTQYARDSAMTSQLQYIWPSDRRQAPHRHCCQSDCRRDIWQRSCWRQWTHRQHYCRTYWHTYTALLSDILTHIHSTTVRHTDTHAQHYCRTYWHTYTALLSDILTHIHSTTVRHTDTHTQHYCQTYFFFFSYACHLP